MDVVWHTISGDTPGTCWRLPFLVFEGRGDTTAPSAYIQGALHANEIPGTAVIHALATLLRAAEDRVLGRIVLVPAANPIGAGQYVFHETQGRFDIGSRENFNRAFPHLSRDDPETIQRLDAAADDLCRPAVTRLKNRLLYAALQHDIVLDLHCDEESLGYLYVHTALWPQLGDLAAALQVDAVITWDETSNDAFEEAALAPWLAMGAQDPARKCVSTVELRGLGDVCADQAETDARGIFDFLVARGVVGAPAQPVDASGWHGTVTPIENIEMVRTAAGGPILYDVKPGDRVRAGDRIARIVHQPGMEDGETAMTAPQDGLVLTRRTRRLARRGDDLIKILSPTRSTTAKSGTLEP